MAINKPTKPDVTLPDSFGGVHTAYTDAQIKDGYEDGIPQVVDGGNVNYEKDGLFKNNKYNRTVADVLVDMPIGKVLTVDNNNRFEYSEQPKPDWNETNENSLNFIKNKPNYDNEILNLEQKDLQNVKKEGNQQINGTKSFSQPIVSNPTSGSANLRCIDPATGKVTGEIYVYKPSVNNITMLFRVWSDDGTLYKDSSLSYEGGSPRFRLSGSTLMTVPNYNNFVTIGSPYIATDQGWVQIQRGTGTSSVYMYVNGVEVAANISNTSNEGGNLSAFVDVGDVVTFSETNINWARFYNRRY